MKRTIKSSRTATALLAAGVLAASMLAFNAHALNRLDDIWSPVDVITDSSGTNQYAYWNDPNNWSMGVVPTNYDAAGDGYYNAAFSQAVGTIIACVVTNDTSVGQLMLGFGGAGTLIITNGANFVAGAPSGFANGVPNNNWTGIGFVAGPGLLYVAKGSTATFGSHLWVGQGAGSDQGTVIVDGGSISIPNGQLGVGWNGTGGTNYLTLTNGGAAYLQTWAAPTLGEPGNASTGILDIWAGSFVVVTNNQLSYLPSVEASNELISFGGAGAISATYNPVANVTTIASIPPFIAGSTPVFTVQPSNTLVGLGGTATFTVAMSNSMPCTFQWQFNSQPLANGNGVSGATTATLTIANVSAANTGVYYVLATNSSNHAFSAPSLTASLSSDSFNLYPVVTINGIPGDTYVVDYTTSLTPPVTWIPLATNTLGSFTQYVVDTATPRSLARFYRVVQQ
ncbi:MAG: immunoglobulin domain-containing protein [Verrucomicrobiota bacterium]|jgi:hypothetical protein